MHWKTKSFAKHIALGDLYENLQELTDKIAEMYMGAYGQKDVPESTWEFNKETELAFVSDLMTQLAVMHDHLPKDGWLINAFEELQGMVAQTKYKIENLS